jgi:hypothetical protein
LKKLKAEKLINHDEVAEEENDESRFEGIIT